MPSISTTSAMVAPTKTSAQGSDCVSTPSITVAMSVACGAASSAEPIP